MTAPELASINLRALIAEVDEARARLQALADELTGIDPGPAASPDRPIKALLAVDLHSYYTLLEALLERLIGTLEGQVPRGNNSRCSISLTTWSTSSVARSRCHGGSPGHRSGAAAGSAVTAAWNLRPRSL